MKYIISICFVLFSISLVFGQNQKLAAQYYNTGEYEKAAISYKKLYTKNKRISHYFEKYISSLIELESFDEANKAIKKELKSNNKKLELYVMLGKIKERQGDEDGAIKEYKKGISKLGGSPHLVIRMANLFVRDAKYKLALDVYEEGVKHIEDPKIYAYAMGDLYWRMGDEDKSIQYFLISVEKAPGRMKNLQTIFHRNLNDEGFKKLITILYQNIQEKPDVIVYSEMLQWCFVTKKQYNKALRQAKAMDRRYEENGKRVFDLGMTAFRDKDFATAIKAFDYIGNEKDKNSRFYLKAKKNLLVTKRSLIIENPSYTITDLDSLEMEYVSFLDIYGRNNQTAKIMIEYAELCALYRRDHKKAIKILTELIELKNINKQLYAEAKLSLGDYHVIDGDVWEATLLYSQVDKTFKEANLGERARFKNAKLSYYNGDFEWAQEQFDFLKSATSKLISNDAIDLSVFIMDNLGLDSTETAMKMYANADLLVFQNKFNDAQILLDSLKNQFPEHTLQDDLLYTKARIYVKKRMYEEAITMYEEIINDYPEEIRADNALFELAQLYELNVVNIQKAISLYEKLFIDYSGSTFSVEARKKYRELRGDGVQ